MPCGDIGQQLLRAHGLILNPEHIRLMTELRSKFLVDAHIHAVEVDAADNPPAHTVEVIPAG